MRFTLLILTLLIYSGCKKDTITVATEPKEDPKLVFDVPDNKEKAVPHGHSHSPQTAAGKVTIVLQKEVGEELWFFKLSGVGQKVFKQFVPFRSVFLDSIKVVDGKVTWTVPDSWTTIKEGEGMLRAEIHAGSPDAVLKISSLAMLAKGNLKNVNRWRRQLGMGPVTEAGLSKAAIINDIPGKQETMFIIGTPDIMSKLLTATEPEKPKTPETNEPEAVDGFKSAPAGSELDYKIPEHWTFGRTSAFRKATFNIGSGDETAEITVIPLGKGSGTLLANVNRWRGQIGLGNMTQADLDKTKKEVTVDGEQGVSVIYTSEAKGVGGVIVDKGEQTWFIKLFGSAAVVEKEHDNFLNFIKTVKFK